VGAGGCNFPDRHLQISDKGHVNAQNVNFAQSSNSANMGISSPNFIFGKNFGPAKF